MQLIIFHGHCKHVLVHIFEQLSVVQWNIDKYKYYSLVQILTSLTPMVGDVKYVNGSPASQ